MKLAYIAPSTIPSQTANSVQVMKVCQALTQLGSEVQLYVPGNAPHVWSELEEFYGVHTQFQIHWLPFRKNLRKLDFVRTALKQAQRDGCGLIYTRMIWAAYLAKMKQMPVILEMHEVPTGKIAPVIYRQYLKANGKKLTVFITRGLQTEIEKNLVVQHDPRRSLIAPDGVDLERYRGLPGPSEARQQLGFADKFTAVYSGGFYTGRGLEILFGLAAAFPEDQFIWIGGKPELVKEWQAKVEQAGLKNVILTGYVPNQRLQFYQAAADVLLMPYALQVAGSSGGNIARVTSPMKLFEYMACGRAILASDLPVLHEILNENNSVFYPPNELPELSAAFKKLREDSSLRQSLGAQAAHDVLKYSWNQRMASILDYFTKM